VLHERGCVHCVLRMIFEERGGEQKNDDDDVLCVDDCVRKMQSRTHAPQKAAAAAAAAACCFLLLLLAAAACCFCSSAAVIRWPSPRCISPTRPHSNPTRPPLPTPSQTICGMSSSPSPPALQQLLGCHDLLTGEVYLHQMSCLTPHTSHLTPHTSHLTHHTSHITPHSSQPSPATCPPSTSCDARAQTTHAGHARRSLSCVCF